MPASEQRVLMARRGIPFGTPHVATARPAIGAA